MTQPPTSTMYPPQPQPLQPDPMTLMTHDYHTYVTHSWPLSPNTTPRTRQCGEEGLCNEEWHAKEGRHDKAPPRCPVAPPHVGVFLSIFDYYCPPLAFCMGVFCFIFTTFVAPPLAFCVERFILFSCCPACHFVFAACLAPLGFIILK